MTARKSAIRNSIPLHAPSSPMISATIIYTSGTTGIPKGAMLTHGNLASNIAHSLSGFPLGDGEISISFLPLSHVTARHVDFAMLYRGVTLAYVSAIDQLAAGAAGSLSHGLRGRSAGL